MNKLTPELHLLSAFDGDTAGAAANESRVLDFQMARRSAVVINRIISQISLHPDTTSGLEITGRVIQEVDLDPDNVELEFANVIDGPDAVVIDSSRVLRHTLTNNFDTAAGLGHPAHTYMEKSWLPVPLNERPISITNLRHTLGNQASVSCFYHAEIHIDYFIVELSLMEIGILNASRR